MFTDSNQPQLDRNYMQIHAKVMFGILNKFDHTALMLSETGTILFANEAFLSLYGLTHEQVQGRKIYDPELNVTSQELWLNALNKAMAEGGKRKYERQRRVNGKTFYSEVSIMIYDVPDGKRVMFMSQDITEAKRSQMEVQELNLLLNKIIDNLPVYLFVKDVDDDLRYLIWNKAFVQYSKIPAEKVIGKTDFEIFPEYKDAQQFRDDDKRVIETGEMTQKTETYVAADGVTRVVQTYKTLVHRQGLGPLLVGISLDITDIEGIEKELVRERMRAEESDRLKSLFLANMSHEIRTPLNAIVGFAGLLSDAEDERQRDKFLTVINENTELLLQLINDILDLSKIEAGTLEYTRMPMDLFDTMRNIQMVYTKKMRNGVHIIFDNENAPCRFIINEDRNRIIQVIDNLINNAIKFTPKGEIHHGFCVKGDWIEVYVSDTGRGIPKEKQDKVFERFVKLDNFVQGTGLGLPICKLIVETLGGQMTLESEEGKGSTFTFTIPYVNDRQAVVNRQPSPQPATVDEPQPQPVAIPKSDRKILVAEDVSSNYYMLQAMLKKRYELLWAHDGVEAVRMAQEKNPDLILMDIKMPNMNGLDATHEIRRFNPNVPIVALTANAFDEDRKMALQAGMNDFLTKPVNRNAFEAILAAYL